MFQGTRNRQALITLYSWYSACFLVVMLLTYGLFFWTNKTLIWTGDGLAQHFPVLAEFRTMLLDAITPGTQSGAWNWNLGLGADVLTTFSYYVCGDIFAYLIPFFGAQHLELAYSVLLILRLYAVGLSFLYFAQHFRFKRSSLLIGTLIYQFSGMTLYISIRHPFFLVPLIILPILCLGIEKVFQQNSSWLLIIATAWALVSNFYFAYMLAIFGLGYAIIRYFGHYRQLSWRPLLGRLAISILLGAALASVLLIPTLLAFLDSSRTQTSFANGLWAYPLSYYLKLPANLLDPSLDSNANYWTQLGIIALNLLGISYVFSHWRQHRATAISLLTALIAMLIPAIGAISNGFTAPSNRWLILASFITAIATMLLSEAWPKLSPQANRQLVFWTVGFLLIVYLFNGLTFGERASYQAIAWLIGTLAVLLLVPHYITNPRVLATSLVGIVLLNLTTVAVNFFSPNGYNGSGQLVQRGATQTMIKGYFDGLDRQPDLTKLKTGQRANTLYNYYPYKPSQSNLSLLTKQPLLGSYFSLQSRATKTLADDLQLAQSTMNDPLQQLDNRTSINQLLGVQRLFVGDQQTKQVPAGYQAATHQQNGQQQPIAAGNQMVPQIDNQQGTTLYITKSAAPVAWFQAHQLSAKAYQNLNPVDREQALTTNTVVTNGGQSTAAAFPRAQTVDYLASPSDKDLLLTPAAIQTALTKQPVTSRQLLANPDQAVQYTPKQQKLVNRLIAQAVQIEDETTGENQSPKLRRDLLGRQISVNLTIQHPERYRNMELFLQLTGVHYQDISAKTKRETAENAHLLENRQLPVFNQFQTWRNNLQYTSDRGYELWATADNADQTQTSVAFQEAKSVLSSYTNKTAWTIDLGTSSQARDTVRLGMQYANQISFKNVKLLAVPMGQSHVEAMHKLQQQRLRSMKITPDRVSGTISLTTKGILTTTIPASSGWQATVNGRPVKTTTVNRAFVGVPLTSGRQRVVLHYHTPGLLIGKMISAVGILATLGWLFFEQRYLNRFTN